MIRFDIKNNIATLQTRMAATKREADRGTKAGMRAAKEPVRDVLKAEMRKAFQVKQERFLRTWRISVRSAPSMVITNIASGFGLHVTGGSIGPRGRSALLIPINTRMGARIGAKRFYSIIDWLHREKLLVAKAGILYAKPLMNESRRGGVGAGTRVQKRFRSKFQGTKRRPSGFEIKLNDRGLTPIAIIRRRISLRSRYDMQSIVTRQIIPIVMRNIANEIELSRAR